MKRSVVVTDTWLKEIVQNVQGLSYGEVHITVHDGQIVQIDRTERHRYQMVKAASGSFKRK